MCLRDGICILVWKSLQDGVCVVVVRVYVNKTRSRGKDVRFI